MDMPASVTDRLDRTGFAIVPSRFDEATIDRIAGEVDTIHPTRHGAGARNLFDLAVIRGLALTPQIMKLVEEVLGPKSAAVRALWFDKTSDANWKVSWHQDLTIAVRERRDVPGFGAWSTKAGVAHVQPPVWILESMLAVRLHIDPCSAANGVLRVLPGSHRAGRIAESDIERWRADVGEVECLAERGDLLLMRPLLLHASSPAVAPTRRRVLHLEFSGTELPQGLQWHDRCASVRAA
jgi:ectoine hydroxylase-related dioxygenase (phytanoyl-CoA dioxygenase family)